MKILIPIKEAAAIMDLSIRAIQIKCKKQGIVKIENQYQITNDILNNWIKDKETKSERTEVFKLTSRKVSEQNEKKSSLYTSLITVILIMLLIGAVIVFYINLDAQINDAKTIIIVKDKEHKTEIKDLNKRLNDATDVIQHQEIEIQYLKIKDSIRTRPKW